MFDGCECNTSERTELRDKILLVWEQNAELGLGWSKSRTSAQSVLKKLG